MQDSKTFGVCRTFLLILLIFLEFLMLISLCSNQAMDPV